MKTKTLAILTSVMFIVWTIVFWQSPIMTVSMYYICIATGLFSTLSMHKGNSVFLLGTLGLIFVGVIIFVLAIASAQRLFAFGWEIVFGLGCLHLIIRLQADKGRRIKLANGEKCKPKSKYAFILPIVFAILVIIPAAITGFCLGDLAFIFAFTVSSWIYLYIPIRILSTEEKKT